MATLYKHPDYQYNFDRWKTAKDLYEGRREVITKSDYLWYHAIELKDKNFDVAKFLNGDKSNISTGASQLRASREQRTRYPGLMEIIVSLWQSLFFAEPCRTDEVLKALLKDHDGEKNIDGFGTSLNTFLQDKLLRDRLLYGKSITLVDSFPVVARNLQEQRELKLRPFMSLINPIDAPDWGLRTDTPQEIGNYSFFRHEFCGVMPRADAESEPTLRKFSHVLELKDNKYTIKEYYVELDNNFKAVDKYWNSKSNTENWEAGKTQETQLDIIPISIYEGDAWLDDVGQEVLRHYNIRSNRDNINYNNGYDVRYAVGDFDEIAIQALSEYTVVILPKDGQFGKLEASNPVALENAERESVEHVFRVGLNKLRQIAAGSKETQSAEAIDKDNEYTFRLVEAELQSIEDSINESFGHYAKFLGKDNFEGKVQLEKKVSAENFDKFIYAWLSFKDSLTKVEGLEKSVVKKVIKKLRLDSEDEKDLLTKVDSINFEQAREQEKQSDPIDDALNG